MKLNTLIVDDELNARENLQLLIQDYCPELNIVGLASSVDQAKVLIKQYSPDLVFLDIAMPQKDGFTLLNEIDNKDFNVVFTTAHSEYALKAFKADAIDYIEKPIDIDDLRKAALKAMKFNTSLPIITDDELIKVPQQVTSEDEIEKISVPTRNGYIFIENREIVYFKASENYTEIILESGKKIVSSKTIKRYEEKMNPNIFYRTHKSYIINKHNHLKELSRHAGNFVVMSNGDCIPIARRRFSDFLKLIS
jgi:two-component system LytT family response regulator